MAGIMAKGDVDDPEVRPLRAPIFVQQSHSKARCWRDGLLSLPPPSSPTLLVHSIGRHSRAPKLAIRG